MCTCARFRYVGRREGGRGGGGGGGGGGEGGEGETWNRAVSEHVTKFKSGGAIVMRTASTRSDTWLPKSASARFDSIAALRSKLIGSMRHGTIDTLSLWLGYYNTPESHYECRSTFRRTRCESFRRTIGAEQSRIKRKQKEEEAREGERSKEWTRRTRGKEGKKECTRIYAREQERNDWHAGRAVCCPRSRVIPLSLSLLSSPLLSSPLLLPLSLVLSSRE